MTQLPMSVLSLFGQTKKTNMRIVVVAICLLSGSIVFAKKKDVTFLSEDGTRLAGTLHLPQGTGPFPAIVFVHGSGKETRKNSAYSAKWFASIGYVALTFDKRGTGDSEGDKGFPNRFNFDTLSKDVVAAVNYLSKVPEVNASKIGLHAVSQGGWVAPLAAVNSSSISFMIIKSASVSTVEEDRIFERAERLKSEGFSEEDLLEVKRIQMVEPKFEDQDAPDEFITLFEEYKSTSWFERVYPNVPATSESLTAYRRWYATHVRFDPVHYLEQLDIPIFWIFGDKELDKLGPVELSLENLSRLMNEGKNYSIQSYEGEGHSISEKKYEQALFSWLQAINNYRTFKFRRH